jgi:hypothetical protein
MEWHYHRDNVKKCQVFTLVLPESDTSRLITLPRFEMEYLDALFKSDVLSDKIWALALVARHLEGRDLHL